MIEDIGQIIKARIQGAPYADRLAGIVQVIQYEESDDNNKKFIHRFPASCDVDSLNCGEDLSRLKDLVPDSKKKSVIFLEDITETNLVERNRNGITYDARIRLVAWINRQQLGKTDCFITGPVMNDLIDRIVTISPINSGPYTRIKFKINKIIPKTPAIFARYTFPLTEKQYLMYPFDYLSLEIGARFTMNPNCLDEFIPGAFDECNDA